MCAIFLKHGDELVEMVEQPYEAEAVLQKLLADYPNLLAGDEDSVPRRRWLLVKRELGIAGQPDGSDRWSVDHLFVDQDGVPTLVEVKRASDTRVRREVVGQLRLRGERFGLLGLSEAPGSVREPLWEPGRSRGRP